MSATRCYAAFAAVAASLAVSACSGGTSSPVSPIAVKASATPAVSAATSEVAYGAKLLAGATYVKRAKVATIAADVIMKMSDAAGLIAYAKAANDPKNALYRHWLTSQELGDRFGVPAADYVATAKYFNANGIAVKTYPQRQLMRIMGSQSNVERTLGVQFGLYKKGKTSFIAPISAPRPSVSLKITGLSKVVHVATSSRRHLTLRATNSFINGYSPQQIANGFDYTSAYAEGYKGDGITIGVIGTGPIADGDPRINGGNGGDVAEFRKIYGVAGTGTVTQDIDLMNVSPGDAGNPGLEYSTGLATPPPVTSPVAPGCVAQGYDPTQGAPTPGTFDYTTCNPEDLEAQIDTEQTAALAPDANVNFYIAYNPDECFGPCSDPNSATPSQEIGLDLSDDEIQQAISDGESDVMTLSYGEGEDAATDAGYFGDAGSDPTKGYGPVELASLVSEGTAVFVSAGDNGAEECSDPENIDNPCVAYPASDPSAVSVGGVNAPLDNSGRLTGPMTGWGVATQYYDEQAPGGSGGGCSTVFSKPAFESGIASVPCGSYRAQPDVALDADTNTGVSAVVDSAPGLGGRQIYSVGGTSVAAPEMAAMWALVIEACKNTPACAAKGSGSTPYRLGNPNTLLYPIYQSSSEYASTFYDVLFGNNAIPPDSGFNAATGYDEVTGIGAPYAKNLITSVLAQVASS